MTRSKFDDKKAMRVREDVLSKDIMNNISSIGQKALFLILLYKQLMFSDKMKGLDNNMFGISVSWLGTGKKNII